ncbi:ABC transporter substrate-binding protein [Bifidobacterium simiiventris]|uniref:ABC transporter substrate-binding protein n=1 Tax=Bifidobacterium simiiventris TaxID=2834434 RepID=UPI001C590142|nr:extracellular solute-binding protein [Bifidobacterium simiiventris]MBW3079139.1 extracellular solute-binding protein [Bifidobacterium simiiventris]
MNKFKPVMASIVSLAVLASVGACGETNSSSGSSDGTVTIKIQNYDTGFGAPSGKNKGADLWNKYMKEHPNVKIEETRAASSDDARAAFNTAISTGSNAYDVYLADIDWMPSIVAMADKFVDLTPYAKDNDWTDVKRETATVNGRLIGAGTDSGPEAICYRADLLEKAGFPSDRESVAKWIGGENATWESYFKAGKEYTEKTGLPWFDSLASTWQSMINQVDESYISRDSNEVIATTNDKVKSDYDQLTSVTDLSAHLVQWSDDWNAAFGADDGFATIQCPMWMLNTIRGNSGEDFKGWDIADVFPGEGGNWGGAFFVVPESSPVKEEAAKLVTWLTAKDQQVDMFTKADHYPSSVSARKDPAVYDKTDEWFNNAPIGKIYDNQANAYKINPYKGDQYFDIQSKMIDALNRVDATKEQTPSESWKQWVNDVKALS